MEILVINNSMKVKAKKWGNSLGLRIPNALVQELDIGDESGLNVFIDGGRLIIEKDKEYKLDDLLKNVTKDNLHKETKTGKVLDKEIW